MPELNEGWIEYKQYLIRSIESLLEASKEHDTNLQKVKEDVVKKIHELETAIKKSLADEVQERSLLGEKIKNMERSNTKRSAKVAVIISTIIGTASIITSILIEVL